MKMMNEGQAFGTVVKLPSFCIGVPGSGCSLASRECMSMGATGDDVHALASLPPRWRLRLIPTCHPHSRDFTSLLVSLCLSKTVKEWKLMSKTNDLKVVGEPSTVAGDSLKNVILSLITNSIGYAYVPWIGCGYKLSSM